MAAKNLGKAQAFGDRAITSSHPDLLDAVQNGTPSPGSYSFIPVQQAQTHQLLSTSFGGADQPLGGGVLTFRTGGFVDTALALDALNGGAGVPRGKIRITDRSGASEVIDLQYARDIDDVLRAINGATTINVSATVEGDALRLTDLSGQALSNLRVQEVGSGTTAAALGLAAIDASSSTAVGSDILSLAATTRLALLNDGNGISLRDGVADLEVSFRDGSTPLQIDLDDSLTATPTVGDVLNALNAADPTRLAAQISTDGDSIELIDKTAGSSEFAVRSLFGGKTAESLGLTEPAVAGVISSRRLLSGLKTTLLSTLGGGQGLGDLGVISPCSALMRPAWASRRGSITRGTASN
jgi:flagellar hook-associated protein 2